MADLIRTFTHPELTAACDAAIAAMVPYMGWRLPDGAEVLSIGRRLLVAEPSGRVIERDDTPGDVPMRDLVAAMRAAS